MVELEAGGNNNGNSNAIQADVNRGFDNQNLQAQTRDILAAVTNGTAQTIAASTQNASNAITAIKDGNASLIIYRKEETMMDASQVVMIVIALIGVVGSVLTNVILNGKAQAVTETKLENLISEVKKHNDFAVKIPAMEVELSNLKETVKDLKAKIK